MFSRPTLIDNSSLTVSCFPKNKSPRRYTHTLIPYLFLTRCCVFFFLCRPSSTAPSPPTWRSQRPRRSLDSGPTAEPTPSTAWASPQRVTWSKWDLKRDRKLVNMNLLLCLLFLCCSLLFLSVCREVCWIQRGGAVSEGEVSGEDGAQQHSLSGNRTRQRHCSLQAHTVHLLTNTFRASSSNKNLNKSVWQITLHKIQPLNADTNFKSTQTQDITPPALHQCQGVFLLLHWPFFYYRAHIHCHLLAPENQH